MDISATNKAVIRTLTEELIVSGASADKLADARKAWSAELKVTPPVVRGLSAYIEYEATRATRLAELEGRLPAPTLGRLARAARAGLPDAAEQALSEFCASSGLPQELVRKAVGHYNEKLAQKEGGIVPVETAITSPLARAAGLAPAETKSVRGHEVDYSKCPLKSAHRELELRFLERATPAASRNDGLTVYLPSTRAHLQGAGLLGIGIEPRNIVGVENEADARAAFEASCRALGVQAHFGDVGKFLWDAGERGVKLRHVLLDFDSQFSGVVAKAIKSIWEPGEFVLTLNVQGRREPAYWRDVMADLAGPRLLDAPADRVSYANPEQFGSRQFVSRFYHDAVPIPEAAKEVVESLRQTQGAELPTKKAREYGFIHGVRALLPVRYHRELPDALAKNDPGRNDLRALVLTNLAYDRLRPAVAEVVKRYAPAVKAWPADNLLYDFCRFAYMAPRFPTACESYAYKSKSASGTTPMFSAFWRIAPVHYIDRHSPSVARFVRLLACEADRNPDAKVSGDYRRQHWGSVYLNTTDRSLLLASRAPLFRASVNSRTVATVTALEFIRALEDFEVVRNSWLHDDHLASIETKEITESGVRGE